MDQVELYYEYPPTALVSSSSFCGSGQLGAQHVLSWANGAMWPCGLNIAVRREQHRPEWHLLSAA